MKLCVCVSYNATTPIIVFTKHFYKLQTRKPNKTKDLCRTLICIFVKEFNEKFEIIKKYFQKKKIMRLEQLMSISQLK